MPKRAYHNSIQHPFHFSPLSAAPDDVIGRGRVPPAAVGAAPAHAAHRPARRQRPRGQGAAAVIGLRDPKSDQGSGLTLHGSSDLVMKKTEMKKQDQQTQENLSRT